MSQTNARGLRLTSVISLAIKAPNWVQGSSGQTGQVKDKNLLARFLIRLWRTWARAGVASKVYTVSAITGNNLPSAQTIIALPFFSEGTALASVSRAS